jgi:hypothetical protein
VTLPTTKPSNAAITRRTVFCIIEFLILVLACAAQP